MSAYVVGKPHLDYILTYGLVRTGKHPLTWLAPSEGAGTQPRMSREDLLKRKRQLTPDTMDAVGHMLLEQNIRSVNIRYGCRDQAEAMYAFEPTNRPLDPVQLLKALQCYEYQACEDPRWEESEAKVFCDALRRRAIGDLPGYEQAAWEIR